VNHPRALLVFCLLSLLASPAFSETPEAKAARQTEQTIDALSRMTDADSLAAAGLLNLAKHRDQSLALIARATAAAPERADLVWLQTQVCQQISPCNPEPLERHLREVDPANGAGWFGALVRAHLSKDDEARDAAVMAIGHSERVDVYWTTLTAHLSRAAARTGKISLEVADVAIIGYLAAEAIPAYTPASLACKGERLERVDVTAACRGLAKSFQRGDNYLTEMIGVAIAKRVWPEDSPDYKAAVEARRVYEYRAKFFAKFDQQGEKYAEDYIALCEKNRREQDVIAALLIKDGKNPNPPAE
jgi:hypothetical protein